MKLYSDHDAIDAFQRQIKHLKQSHLFWCSVVLQWSSAEAAPWIKDKKLLFILEQQISKAMDLEKDKAELLAFSTGDLVFFAESPTNAAYKRVQLALEATVRELQLTHAEAAVFPFDLSVEWEAFIQISREVYNRFNQLTSKSKAEEKTLLLQRLDEETKRYAAQFRGRQSKPKSLNLLFVEDEPSIRQLLNAVLGDTPHSLTFAANGREAIEAYCRKPPHIMFLDINLPDISGHEVLEIIARHDPSTYAVMLTSHTAQADVETAKRYGVKSYIIKPFSRQKLNDSIERYFAS